MRLRSKLDSTLISFFHYKSENENGITIRYPFFFQLKNENGTTTCYQISQISLGK